MEFEVEKTVNYWKEGAEYDLETAEALFESRYPEEQKVFYRKCTREFTENNLKQIKEVFAWLKEKL